MKTHIIAALLTCGAVAMAQLAFTVRDVQPLSKRTSQWSKAPSHEIGDADTENVEVLRTSYTPAATQKTPSKAYKSSKRLSWTCTDRQLQAVPNGTVGSYGSVSVCEWR